MSLDVMVNTKMIMIIKVIQMMIIMAKAKMVLVKAKGEKMAIDRRIRL